jgi:hypothetical protein
MRQEILIIRIISPGMFQATSPIKVTPLKSNNIETAVSRESVFISLFFSGFSFRRKIKINFI